MTMKHLERDGLGMGKPAAAVETLAVWKIRPSLTRNQRQNAQQTVPLDPFGRFRPGVRRGGARIVAVSASHRYAKVLILGAGVGICHARRSTSHGHG
jgi:hypothetical protein